MFLTCKSFKTSYIGLITPKRYINSVGVVNSFPFFNTTVIIVICF
nr:MAG TPA: hypothetical protein [Caudoviricetes sp.]